MADIVSTDDVLGGAPRIKGRRIGVHHIAGRVVDAGATGVAVLSAITAAEDPAEATTALGEVVADV